MTALHHTHTPGSPSSSPPQSGLWFSSAGRTPCHSSVWFSRADPSLHPAAPWTYGSPQRSEVDWSSHDFFNTNTVVFLKGSQLQKKKFGLPFCCKSIRGVIHLDQAQTLLTFLQFTLKMTLFLQNINQHLLRLNSDSIQVCPFITPYWCRLTSFYCSGWVISCL